MFAAAAGVRRLQWKRERRNSNKTRKRRQHSNAVRLHNPLRVVGGAPIQHRRIASRPIASARERKRGQQQSGRWWEWAGGMDGSTVLMFRNISLTFYRWEKKKKKKRRGKYPKRWLHRLAAWKTILLRRFFFRKWRDAISIISHLRRRQTRSCIILIIIERWFLFNLLGLSWGEWGEVRRSFNSSRALFSTIGRSLKWHSSRISIS